MAYTVNKASVRTPSALQNVDSDGNVEQRGAMVCGSIDINAYAAPEVVSSAALGLNVIYEAFFFTSETAEHELHNSVVAAGGKSVSLTFDDVGTGTEAGTDDIGKIGFIAFGEALGSGTN
jgi:hypothetical protein